MTDEQPGRDSLVSTGEATSVVPWSRCTLLSLGHAIEPALVRDQRGCDRQAADVCGLARFTLHTRTPWNPQSWTRREMAAGHVARGAGSSSGASTDAGAGFVKAVNFNLLSPLRSACFRCCCCSYISALHNGESEDCAQTQCGAERLACKRQQGYNSFSFPPPCRRALVRRALSVSCPSR